MLTLFVEPVSTSVSQAIQLLATPFEERIGVLPAWYIYQADITSLRAWPQSSRSASGMIGTPSTAAKRR
jgi:hypothetical protein